MVIIIRCFFIIEEKNKRRLEVNSRGDGGEGKGVKEEEEEVGEGGAVEGIRDVPRWDCDGAKFGKRRMCVLVCAHERARRLAESAMVPVSRL